MNCKHKQYTNLFYKTMGDSIMKIEKESIDSPFSQTVASSQPDCSIMERFVYYLREIRIRQKWKYLMTCQFKKKYIDNK